jgi:hypothetical protein
MVLTALRAGGDLQTVKQLWDRLAQAGHPLKPALSRLPSASWRRPGWPLGARNEPAGPATVTHHPNTHPADAGEGGERDRHDPAQQLA